MKPLKSFWNITIKPSTFEQKRPGSNSSKVTFFFQISGEQKYVTNPAIIKETGRFFQDEQFYFRSIYFFFETPTVRPLRPVVLVC